MNLTRLFETQANLDENIMKQHPELRAQENLSWKILALQVELAECANEWRGFKKWSMDQKPRVWERIKCPSCEKKGYERGKPPVDPIKGAHALGNHWYHCDKCAGFLVIDINPMLVEYVDCLHFILSIALEKIDYCGIKLEIREIAHSAFSQPPVDEVSLISQFNGLFLDIGILYDAAVDKAFDYQTVEDAYTNVWRTFVGLGEMLGFTWPQIEAAYYAKNEVNHERQLAGY